MLIGRRVNVEYNGKKIEEKGKYKMKILQTGENN